MRTALSATAQQRTVVPSRAHQMSGCDAAADDQSRQQIGNEVVVARAERRHAEQRPRLTDIALVEDDRVPGGVLGGTDRGERDDEGGFGLIRRRARTEPRR